MLVSVFFFLGVFLLILQTTLFQVLPEWAGKPDLLFVLIVFLAIRMDMIKGAVLVLLFGLLMDIFSGIYLGLHPVIYLMLFFALNSVTKHLAINESVHHVPIVIISYLLACSGIYIFASILSPANDLVWSWGQLFLQIVILAIITAPFFKMYTWTLSLLEDRAKLSYPWRKPKSGNRFI